MRKFLLNCFINSNSSRLSPKLARLSFSGSVPNLTSHSPNSPSQANLSYLLSPNRKTSNLVQSAHKRQRHHPTHSLSYQSGNGRHLKSRGTRISSSLIQRTTRESTGSLLQPISAHKHYWHAMSIDETGK